MSNIEATDEINTQIVLINNTWGMLNDLEVVLSQPRSYEAIVTILDTLFPNMFPHIVGLGIYLENIYTQTFYTILTELSQSVRSILIRRECVYYDFQPVYMNLFGQYIIRFTRSHQSFTSLTINKRSMKTSCQD